MRFFLFITLSLIANLIYAQSDNVAINNEGTPPDPSAILDINSNNKGVAFPRMTTAQRNDIEAPVTGLIIYNTDSDCLEYYAGLLWFEICGTVASDNSYPPGIYVSLNGDDINGDGTPSNPYRTVEKGLEEMTIGDTLRIAGGTYNENSLTVYQKTNFVISGGYDEFTWVNKETSVTRIHMKPNTFFQIDESNNILLKDIRIVGNLGNENITSSYGLKVLESTGIMLDSCWVESLNGFSPSSADSGTPGVSGIPGANGGDAYGGPSIGGQGGDIGGGYGGYGSAFGMGENGQDGNGGAPGGLGATNFGEDGGNGMDGVAGSAGDDGLGGASFGSDGINYDPSNGTNGIDGNNGTGGGGGGGGGGYDDNGTNYYGGGGGGGGGGGYGGYGGDGGQGGGGSFAIYVHNSTITINNCIVTSQNGGNGGDGGQGGDGGFGNIGGIGAFPALSDITGNGGNGGAGGAGGRGGHGGGGGGGPSFALYSSGTSAFSLTGNILNHGAPGNGGISLAGGASNGAVGVSGDKNF